MGGHCRQGPRRGTSPTKGQLPSSPAPATSARKREKSKGFCKSCCCLAVREPLIKTTGLRISLLLKLSSPATQKLLFLGDAHVGQLGITARAAPRGHGHLNMCSLGGKGSSQGCTHKTEQARGASPLTSGIKHQGSLTHQRGEGHLQELQFTLCLSQRGLVAHVKSPFSAGFGGATGITATLHSEGCSWGRWRGHSHSASSFLSTKSKGEMLYIPAPWPLLV